MVGIILTMNWRRLYQECAREKKGFSSLWFWTCVLCPLKDLCLSVCSNILACWVSLFYLVAFKPFCLHRATILFLSCLYSAWTNILTIIHFLVSIARWYFKSSHSKIINNVLPSLEGLFQSFKFKIFEILTKLLVMLFAKILFLFVFFVSLYLWIYR